MVNNQGYWSVQGYAGGFYAGYGSQGGFAGFGYRYAGFSAGVSYGREGFGVGVGYGGTTSNNLNGAFNLGWSQKGGFDFGFNGGYTLSIERKVQNYTVLVDATSTKSGGVTQNGDYDCVFGCMEFIDPSMTQSQYKQLAGNPNGGLTGVQIDALIKKSGKQSLPWMDISPEVMAMQIQRGEFGILSTKTGAANLNHAVVPRKIEARKVVWSFNSKARPAIQQYNITAMNPAPKSGNIWISNFSTKPTLGLRYFQIK